MFCFTSWERLCVTILTATMADKACLPIVSGSQDCYHQSVIRFKSFPAKIALAVAITISAAMYAAAPDAIVLPPVPTTVDSITPGELRMHLQFLASEELGGRYTLSPGFAIAARYLESWSGAIELTLPFVPDGAGSSFFKFCSAAAATMITAGLWLLVRRYGFHGPLSAVCGAFLALTIAYNRARHFRTGESTDRASCYCCGRRP